MRYDLKKFNLDYKPMEYQVEKEMEILLEGKFKNYQFYILNLGTHPTAYIEIPKGSRLFQKGYDEIYENGLDLDVHGGLTYASSILPSIKENSWFIGWDYIHFGDYAGYDEMYPKNLRRNSKKWTTEEIFNDVACAIDQIIEYEYCEAKTNDDDILDAIYEVQEELKIANKKLEKLIEKYKERIEEK